MTKTSTNLQQTVLHIITLLIIWLEHAKGMHHELHSREQTYNLADMIEISKPLRTKRQVDEHIPFAQSTGLIDSAEARTIAAAACKANCLRNCAKNFKQKADRDPTVSSIKCVDI